MVSGGINFNAIDAVGSPLWINQVTLPSPQPFSITALGGGNNNSPGGRIKFGGSGIYIMRIMLNLSVGSLASVSYGSTTSEITSDAYTNGQLTSPNFTATYTFPVSPDPSSPLMLPINVLNNSTFYISFTV